MFRLPLVFLIVFVVFLGSATAEVQAFSQSELNAMDTLTFGIIANKEPVQYSAKIILKDRDLPLTVLEIVSELDRGKLYKLDEIIDTPIDSIVKFLYDGEQAEWQ